MKYSQRWRVKHSTSSEQQKMKTRLLDIHIQDRLFVSFPSDFFIIILFSKVKYTRGRMKRKLM